MKRITLTIIAILSIACMIIAITACQPTDSKTPVSTPDPTPDPVDPTPPPIVVVESMTEADFLASHMDAAIKFINTYAYDEALAGKEVLAHTWSIQSTSDKNALDKASVLYTYKTGETTRAIEMTSVDFDEDVAYIDLSKTFTNAQIQTKAKAQDPTGIFEFDAKVCSENQSLADSIYSAYNTSSDVKLFNLSEGSSNGWTKVSYLQLKDGSFSVHQFEVRSADTMEELKKNVDDPYATRNHTSSSGKSLGGTKIIDSGYALEKFESAVKPDPGPGEEIEPPAVISNAKILQVLDEQCKVDAVKKCFTFAIDESKISNGTWYVTKDSDGNVTGAEYSFNYVREVGVNRLAYFALGKVNFTTPITTENIKDDGMKNAAFEEVFALSYDDTIQDSRKELTDAICKTVFRTGDDVKTTCYIVDNGTLSSDPHVQGIVHMFTVYEVSENIVREADVNISTTGDYISNLSDETKYSVPSETSYNISGTKLDEKDVQTEIDSINTNSRIKVTLDDEVCLQS